MRPTVLLCAVLACAAAPAQVPPRRPGAPQPTVAPLGVAPYPSCYDREVRARPYSAAAGQPQTRDFGLGMEAVRGVVAGSWKQIKTCYERELERQPHLEGVVSFSWTIEPSGKVAHAHPVEVTLASPAVVDCMGQSICRMTFPASPAPTTVGIFPFVFKNSR